MAPEEAVGSDFYSVGSVPARGGCFFLSQLPVAGKTLSTSAPPGSTAPVVPSNRLPVARGTGTSGPARTTPRAAGVRTDGAERDERPGLQLQRERRLACRWLGERDSRAHCYVARGDRDAVRVCRTGVAAEAPPRECREPARQTHQAGDSSGGPGPPTRSAARRPNPQRRGRGRPSARASPRVRARPSRPPRTEASRRGTRCPTRRSTAGSASSPSAGSPTTAALRRRQPRRAG